MKCTGCGHKKRRETGKEKERKRERERESGRKREAKAGGLVGGDAGVDRVQ